MMLEVGTIIYLSTISTQVVVTSKTQKHFSQRIQAAEIKRKIIKTKLQYQGQYYNRTRKCFYTDAWKRPVMKYVTSSAWHTVPTSNA